MKSERQQIEEIKQEHQKNIDALALLEVVVINIQNLALKLQELLIEKDKEDEKKQTAFPPKVILYLFVAAYIFDHIFDWFNLR